MLSFFIRAFASEFTNHFYFTIQASGGVELSQTDADENLISKLKNIELPALVSLHFEAKITSGRKVKMVVTDLLIEDNYVR